MSKEKLQKYLLHYLYTDPGREPANAWAKINMVKMKIADYKKAATILRRQLARHKETAGRVVHKINYLYTINV